MCSVNLTNEEKECAMIITKECKKPQPKRFSVKLFDLDQRSKLIKLFFSETDLFLLVVVEQPSH